MAVLAGIGIGTYLFCDYYGWPESVEPEWMAAIVVGGIVALAALIVLIRKIVFRRREEGFVRQVIEQDESSMTGAPVFERQQLQDLEKRWKQALLELKNSHLRRRRGGALYALPWYLMIGENGSGKTSALRNSRLPSAFPELGHPTGESATRNLDFWFFEDSVVLDTAGRYTIHQDLVKDKEEWKKFLTLLTRHRKREPLNGVIVTVSADKLTKDNAEQMEHYGRIVHQAIDQTMRITGHNFPVYLLVTKVDQVLGMRSFTDMLPWKAHGQAMGNINHAKTQNSLEFLDETLECVTERLKDLRLLILNQHQESDPTVLLFPDELPNLRPGLASFVRWAFQENPYHESPLLRGIFFTSSNQAGSSRSNSLESLGVSLPLEDKLPGTNRGYFLQEVFSKVIPDDRHMIYPIREFINWRRTTRGLAVIALALATFVVCSLIGISHIKNYRAMDSFREGFFKSPPLMPPTEDEMLAGAPAFNVNLERLEMLRNELIDLEEYNHGWMLPRMGMRQSLAYERRLKDIYIAQVERGMLRDVDTNMAESMEDYGKEIPDLVTGEYADHLSKRINITRTRLVDGDLGAMLKKPMPSNAVLTFVDEDFRPTSESYFRDHLVYSLNWEEDEAKIKKANQESRERLAQLLRQKGDNMEWLRPWANREEEDLSPVTLSDFWDDKIPGTYDSEIKVEPAFTIAGHEVITEYIGRMEEAFEVDTKHEYGIPEIDSKVLPERIGNFNVWYFEQYAAAWHLFCRRFVAEEEEYRVKRRDVAKIERERERNADEINPFENEKRLLRSRAQWQGLATQMTSFQNPYFDLLEEMSRQFEIYKLDTAEKAGGGGVEMVQVKVREGTPNWIALVLNLEERKGRLDKEETDDSTTASTKTEKKLRVLKRKADRTTKSIKGLVQESLVGVEELEEYKKALANVSPALNSKDLAYQMASQLFKDKPDPSSSGSPFDQGFVSLRQQQALLGSARKEDQVVWDLMGGPLEFLIYFTCQEAACALQTAWEEEVLAEIQGIPEANLQEALFGDSGLVWKYVDGTAKPFLSRNRRGYYSRAQYGQEIPFLPSFFEFLRSGAVGKHMLKEEYEVRIAGLPTDVNVDAKEKPEGVIIEMICADEVQRLENWNYPVEQIFKWNPDTCGGVKMEIQFQDFTLSKGYPGFTGFPEFLRDFRSGEMVIRSDQFSIVRQEQLNRVRVKFISVKFDILGHEPLIERIERTPLSAEENIVYCWN